VSRPLHIGGLFRCCIATFSDYDGADAEGMVIGCRWCQTEMLVRDGVWQFDERASCPGRPRPASGCDSDSLEGLLD